MVGSGDGRKGLGSSAGCETVEDVKVKIYGAVHTVCKVENEKIPDIEQNDEGCAEENRRSGDGKVQRGVDQGGECQSREDAKEGVGDGKGEEVALSEGPEKR